MHSIVRSTLKDSRFPLPGLLTVGSDRPGEPLSSCGGTPGRTRTYAAHLPEPGTGCSPSWSNDARLDQFTIDWVAVVQLAR